MPRSTAVAAGVESTTPAFSFGADAKEEARWLRRRYELSVLHRHDHALIERAAIRVEIEFTATEDDRHILDLEKRLAHRVARGVRARALDRRGHKLRRGVYKRRAVVQ